MENLSSYLVLIIFFCLSLVGTTGLTRFELLAPLPPEKYGKRLLNLTFIVFCFFICFVMISLLFNTNKEPYIYFSTFMLLAIAHVGTYVAYDVFVQRAH